MSTFISGWYVGYTRPHHEKKVAERHSYNKGMEIDGILNFIRTGNEMERVSDKIIEDIKLITEKVTDVDVSEDYFTAGEQLIVRDGPLTGLSCEMVIIKKQPRVLVRVNLLHRNLIVSLPSGSLVRASI